MGPGWMSSGSRSTGRGKVEEQLPREPIAIEIVCAVPPARYREKTRLRILSMREVFQQPRPRELSEMPRHDWLVGRDRRSEAAERIYAAAAELIARRGYEAFSIETLAARAHCSPATIYRHAGGKTAIRDAVVAIQGTRIVDAVRDAIKDLTGPGRVVAATIIALDRVRSHPMTQLFQSMNMNTSSNWLTNSPTVQ